MLFRDNLCLAVDGADFERVQRVARDFRGCTTTIKLGPAFLLTWGLYGVRGLGELGMRDIILDARLFGHHQEIWTAVTEAAKLPGIAGIVVQSICGTELLTLAVEAADKSRDYSQRINTPKIIGAAVPAAFNAAVMRQSRIDLKTRFDFVCQQAIICHSAGVHAMIVEYEDIPHVKRVCPDLPLLVNIRRRVESYEVAISPEEQSQPGPYEVMLAGAAHAILAMELIGHDAEWCADMVAKELAKLQWSQK